MHCVVCAAAASESYLVTCWHAVLHGVRMAAVRSCQPSPFPLHCFLLFVAVVTCMALDAAGCHLITGSRDLTCAIWEFSKDPKLFEHPLQTLYGHDDEVRHTAQTDELHVITMVTFLSPWQ